MSSIWLGDFVANLNHQFAIKIKIKAGKDLATLVGEAVDQANDAVKKGQVNQSTFALRG